MHEVAKKLAGIALGLEQEGTLGRAPQPLQQLEQQAGLAILAAR